jgi:hypothetical protein
MLTNRGSPSTQAQYIICSWNMNILAHMLPLASFFLCYSSNEGSNFLPLTGVQSRDIAPHELIQYGQPRCFTRALVRPSAAAHVGATRNNSTSRYLNFTDHLRAQRNQAKSPFLQLPAEVRNRIYEYVLEDQPVLVTGGLWPNYYARGPYYYSLFFICRQIYDEAAACIIYC